MSCLFNSLGSLLKVDPSKLRADVCSFLEQHSGSLVEGLAAEVVLETKVEEYVHKMRNPSTWGGAVEIQSICQMYGVEVQVETPQGSTVHFVPRNCPTSITHILKVRWTGAHYTPVGVFPKNTET